MSGRLLDVDPAAYQPHSLHHTGRAWPETNCYVDLWIEVIASLGQEPEAMLGFTVTQDFEGDQFTFFKVPLEDLEILYGIVVGELAIYDRVENHARVQRDRGRLVLVEVDGCYLPDTRGVSYREKHTKTTIGINALDVPGRSMEYFHNAGLFRLEGEDFDLLFNRTPAQRENSDLLFPYAEFAKFPAVRGQPVDRGSVERLLARHLSRRPRQNPVAAFRAAFPSHVEHLARQPLDGFHDYAFNTLRQLGANFELLRSHLHWLDGSRFERGIVAAGRIADGAKTAQFQLARAVSRGRPDALGAILGELAEAYDALMDDLDRALA